MEQNNWYISIPANILTMKELSSTEKLLYGIVSNLQSMYGICTASNSYFAECLNISISQVSTIISNLVDKNIFVRTVITNDAKQIIKRELKIHPTLCAKNNIPSPRKPKPPHQKNSKGNNTIEYKGEGSGMIKIST
jgi:hypothetical protein